MMTSFPPGGEKPRFFLMLPTTASFVPEKAYLSFSLPAGIAFPTNLTRLMEKTERFLTFEDSEIEGVEFQKCNGVNCVCTACREQQIVCDGAGCKGFMSSTDDIQCSDPNCIPTNNIEYSMFPLYPNFMLAYMPKFRFIRYVPAGTATPSSSSSGDYVLFSVSFASMDVFDTADKFSELAASLATAAPSGAFRQHNTAILQRILRKNNLPRDLLLTSGKPPKKVTTQTPPPSGVTKKPRAPATKPPIVERYDENDIVLTDLVVPETENTDTDNTPIGLLTPEPDFLTTSPPRSSGMSLDVVTKIIIICLGSILMLGIITIIITSRGKPKKSNVATKR